MKKILQLVLGLVILFSLSVNEIVAQDGVLASSGDTPNSNISTKYTANDLADEESSSEDGSLSKGVQKAMEVYVVAGIKEAECIKLLVTAFPNPTSNYLTLSVEDKDYVRLGYQLFDTQGKLLQEHDVDKSQTCINMKDLEPAIYLVRVVDGPKEVKTFKIVKK